ncbi:hypothetical protein NXY77_16455, partial [Escherichia coli]|nr:hypothetical protein [Escherichia coli]MCS0835534.1 hypothetical protein [Escherichia coli]
MKFITLHHAVFFEQLHQKWSPSTFSSVIKIKSDHHHMRRAHKNSRRGGIYVQPCFREVAIKWSAAPDMTPQTVLYRRPVAQFSNFQPKIVSSWLILA